MKKLIRDLLFVILGVLLVWGGITVYGADTAVLGVSFVIIGLTVLGFTPVIGMRLGKREENAAQSHATIACAIAGGCAIIAIAIVVASFLAH